MLDIVIFRLMLVTKIDILIKLIITRISSNGPYTYVLKTLFMLILNLNTMLTKQQERGIKVFDLFSLLNFGCNVSRFRRNWAIFRT